MDHKSPAHYTRGSIEVWDFIRDQELNYHLGNAIKYICRAGFKGDNTKAKDLKKAIHYLENELLHTHELDGSGGTVPLRVLTDDWEGPTEWSKALIDEEWSEFHEAYHMKDECEQLKELADLVYVCYQFAASQEWDLDEAMHRVHKSNMSKLGEDGKPLYRVDGKVMKGPNYQPPNLNDLIIE